MYQFKFADIGEGIHEAVVTNIHVKHHQEIKENDVLISVETDKVTTDITSPVSGKIVQLYCQVNETIKVGDVLFDIELSTGIDNSVDNSLNNSLDEFNQEADDQTKKFESVSVVGTLKSSEQIMPSFKQHDYEQTSQPILISPMLRKLAQDKNIDLKILQDKYPGKKITLADIEQEIDLEKINNNIDEQQNLKHEITKKILVSQTRQAIAKAMINSNQNIPQAVIFHEIDVSELVKFKKTLELEFKTQHLKLTYLPLIIKAVTLALKKHPQFNSTYDHETKTITYKYFYNIGIAIDHEKGLIVPVLKNVDKDSLGHITKKLNDLNDKIIHDNLQLNDLKNSTFTITNYGSLGLAFGTPIINYPESAIIGIGKIAPQVKVGHNNDLVIKNILPLSITIDHRIIDGGDVGRFLNTLTHYLSQPHLLLELP